MLYDKFCPKNESRGYEFMHMICQFTPERVKFVGKESLKGQEMTQNLHENPPCWALVAGSGVDARGLGPHG